MLQSMAGDPALVGWFDDGQRREHGRRQSRRQLGVERLKMGDLSETKVGRWGGLQLGRHLGPKPCVPEEADMTSRGTDSLDVCGITRLSGTAHMGLAATPCGDGWLCHAAAFHTLRVLEAACRKSRRRSPRSRLQQPQQQ